MGLVRDLHHKHVAVFLAEFFDLGVTFAHGLFHLAHHILKVSLKLREIDAAIFVFIDLGEGLISLVIRASTPHFGT